MDRRKRSHFILGILTVYLGLAAVVYFGTVLEENLRPPTTPIWGVTFVPSYAEYLGTDAKESLTALLDDLKVKHFRLSIPWDRAEASQGQFNFSEIGWQLDELGKRGADAFVSIGRRTPRWPECHDPDWIDDLTLERQDEAALELVRAEVTALKGRKEIVAWQVENEPFLAVFGRCPSRLSPAYFKREVALVHELDPSRPVITTDSGELSTWFRAAPRVDELGISIYHETWNGIFGKIVYPLPPAFYRRRVEFTKAIFGTEVFVSELQAEPWSGTQLSRLTPDEQVKLLGPEKLAGYLRFAERTGLPSFYLWGAEWWYSLKIHGHPELWETVRSVFAKR